MAGDPEVAGQAGHPPGRGKLELHTGRWGEAVSKLPKNVADGDIPQCIAWGKEPVDFAKCPISSTLQFPRSEIAATMQCLMCAYARF